MKNQQFKSVTLSRVKTVNNILKIWSLAQDSDKYDWYTEAYDFAVCLTKVSQVNVPQACGIIAAFSPLKTWDQNKAIALSFVTTGKAGHMGAFVKKAQAILQAETEEDILRILSGRKIQSFFLNILYPAEALSLTIDRHALSVALGHWITETEYAGMTARQYAFFSECYRHAAKRLNVNPLLVQSATWLVWRRIKKTF